MTEGASSPARGTPGTVQSVGRSLELIEAVARLGDAGLVELSEATGLSPSTTHRLLATLIAYGWVAQDPRTSRYRLGQRLVAIAGGAEARSARLRAAAQPAMRRLRDEYDETTNLVVLDGLSIVYIDQVESSRPVRMFSQIGNRVPAHASGAGKAQLAYQPHAVVDALSAREPFDALTPRTITAASALHEELARIRARGFAFDEEEYDEGVTCVAAPVFDHSGEVLAAISMSGPSARMSRLDLMRVGERIVQMAGEVSGQLGHSITPDGEDA
jgi:IclR family acetate operon transcriptional repressor